MSSGFTSERIAARHILSGLALAGSAKPPRTEGARLLPVPLQCQAQRGLHQSISLQARGKPSVTASTRSSSF